MTTITKGALEYIKDEVERLQSEVDDLEEELEKALDENAAMRVEITRLMSDRSLAV